MPLDPKKIRARRDALKLTQLEAATRAGMPRPNWAALESGDAGDVRVSTAERAAAALRCGVDDLLIA